VAAKCHVISRTSVEMWLYLSGKSTYAAYETEWELPPDPVLFARWFVIGCCCYVWIISLAAAL